MIENKVCIGSDGGGEFYGNIGGPNIGYSDGQPFLSVNRHWEMFPSATHEVSSFNQEEKMCGMSYGYFANRGELSSPEGILSQNLMYEINNNWVCLTITNYQDYYHSTHIYMDHLKTPTDNDIEGFVKRAHTKGVKVCLKPMVHSNDNVWRAYIDFPRTNMEEIDVYWSAWFESYKNFLLHYAEIAQRVGAEMFCIGCEMIGAEKRESEWRYIIKEVKRVYSGKIVYNTNHDHEDDQEWFNEMDYMATSAYYPVGATYDEMVKEWTKIRERLDAIAEKRNKKFIFMEVGCRSIEGAAQYPWDFNSNTLWSEEEQNDFYRSLLDVFMPDSYFAGVFWWNWPTLQYHTREDAKLDKDYNIHLKKAEETVKKVYTEANNG